MRLLVHIIVGLFRIFKGLILRGGNAVSRHKRFGEIFGAFQLGSGLGATENRQTCGTEIVHNTSREQCFGTYECERDLLIAAN